MATSRRSEGRSLTDFVIASVQAEATRVIEQHQRLTLSDDDSEAFVAALLNPPRLTLRSKRQLNATTKFLIANATHDHSP